MIELCDPETISRVLNYLEERFGMQRTLFADFAFYAGPKGRIIVGPKQYDDRLSPDTAGLLVARVNRSVKPSTNLLQIFGRDIERNVIILSKPQTLKYLQGLDIKLTEDDQINATNGYVLLKFDSYPLGCGLYQADSIKNMLPRAKRTELDYL